MSNGYNKNKYFGQRSKNKRNKIWKELNEKFVNPYGFISLVDKCKKENFNAEEFCKNQQNLLTGWIDCIIETKTPIFIPNTSNDNAFNQYDAKKTPLKSYDFFSYDDISNVEDRSGKYSQPVIPGSQMRGVIRSAFEAATNSCMSTIDEERVLYKRTSEVKDPGILYKENNQWFIRPAERVMLKTKECIKDLVDKFTIDKLQEGQEVYILRSENPYDNDNRKRSYTVRRLEINKFKNSVKGYLHKSEPFARKKHHESVFIPKQKENPIAVKDDAVNRLREVVELYKYNRYHKEFEIKEERTLVYYSKDKKYLSPACITKEVFENRLKCILKRQGGFDPCRSIVELCPACTLFGMTSDKESVASRVRFSDALPKNTESYEEYFEPEIILAELASPKISATEFYLERPPKGDLWNYDYAIIYKGRNKERVEGYKAKINGRKFYWHMQPVKGKSYYQLNDSNKNNVDIYNERNTIIRPVKKDKQFYAKVYFDSVTKSELNRLIWVLNLGDNSNENCHKIGKGKPLGYGSIKVKTEKINYRNITIKNNSIQYDIVSKNINGNRYFKKDIINENLQNVIELKKITDFKNRPNNVSYPLADNGRGDKNAKASHQWFAANKLINPKNLNNNRKMQNISIYRELPKISNENKRNELSKYIKE